MVTAMNSYWREHPPVHLLVAGYLDYKPGLLPEELAESADMDRFIEDVRSDLPDHLLAAVERYTVSKLH